MEKLEDFDFVDDVALLSSNANHMQAKTRQICSQNWSPDKYKENRGIEDKQQI